MNNLSFSHEQISELAHRFYEEEGRPHGRSEHHWQRAIETLQELQPEAKASTAKLSEAIPKTGKKPALPSKLAKPAAAKSRTKPVAKR